MSLLLLVASLTCVADSAWVSTSPPRKVHLLSTRQPVQQKQRFAREHFSSAESVLEQPTTNNVITESALLRLPVNQWNVPEALLTLMSIVTGTMTTYALNNYLAQGPILSSSVVGLVSAVILPEKQALAALCGSFAGMAKFAVIPGIAASALLGFICSMMMALFDKRKWLVGVGGRLGFIAQCACTFQFLLSCLVTPPTAPAALVGHYPDIVQLMAKLPSVIVFTVCGAFGMRMWKEVMAKTSNRLSTSVAAVGGTGLLAAALLPPSASGPAFCGTFVAMAAPTKISNLKALFFASVMAAVCQQSLAGVLLGGWGGKWGTAALMGVLSYNVLDKVKGILKQSKKEI